MKRILMLAMILAFVMIPVASFAKKAISDSDLDAITAKAGISIVFTKFSISSLSLSTISWGDSDGIPNGSYSDASTGYNNAGYLGANGMTIAGDLVELSGVMNIDTGTSGTGVGASRLKIDLPSMTIGGSTGMNITGTLTLDSTKTLNSTNASALAAINIKGFQTFVSGSVTIFAH
jgi:hypothetical protein